MYIVYRTLCTYIQYIHVQTLQMHTYIYIITTDQHLIETRMAM